MDDIWKKIEEIDNQNKIMQSTPSPNQAPQAPQTQVQSPQVSQESIAAPNNNLKNQADMMAQRRKSMEKRFGKGVSEGTHKMVGIDEDAYKKKQEIIERELPPTYKHFFIFDLPAPVPKYEAIKVLSPSMSKVIEIGEDEISRLTIPFTVTIDSLFYNSDHYLEIVNKFSVFKLFYGEDESVRKTASQVCGGEPFEELKKTLSLFCPGCEIRTLESAARLTNSGKKKLIIIPEGKTEAEGIIFDEKVYNAMRPVIQDSMRTKDAKRPRVDRGQSEYIKENNRLMNQKEQYDRKKNAPELAGMINVVAHGGSDFIPYEQIYKMNWFQFISSYESISEIVGYDSMIGYKLSANFQVKDEVKHWLPAVSLQKKEESKKPVL